MLERPAAPRLRLHRGVHAGGIDGLSAAALAGTRFLPVGRRRPGAAAFARAQRYAHRADRHSVDQVEAVSDDDSGRRARHAGRQHRGAVQWHQSLLQHFRPDRAGRRGHHDCAAPAAAPADDRVRARAAITAARPVPLDHVLVPAVRHSQPDPELRTAVAIRRAGGRIQCARQSGLCQCAAGKAEDDSRRGRPADSAGVRLSAAQRGGGSHQRRAARLHPAGRGDQPADLALGQPADRADILGRSEERASSTTWQPRRPSID